MSRVSSWRSTQTASGKALRAPRYAGLVLASALQACGGGADGAPSDAANPPAPGASQPTMPAAGTAGAPASGQAAMPSTMNRPAASAGTAMTPASSGSATTTTPAASGGNAMAPAGNAGTPTMGTTSPTTGTMVDPMMPTTGATTDAPPYHDPGTGPWEMGSSEECKMDTGMIGGLQNMAVFRYGKLCHISGGNTTGQNWSSTKTLGGVLAGRAAYLVKDVPRMGPGSGPILHEDKATDWLGNVSYNQEALLSHVMAMVAHNLNLSYGAKSFSYDTVGSVQISSIVSVSMVALEQTGSPPGRDTEFMNTEVFGKLGMGDSSWPGGTIGYGWTGTLEDMGRVGTMLAHDGWYGGERFMEASWVYRMSHPSHEDANTAYGQLAWLNNRGGGTSFGAAIDTCAPAAFWPKYPHVGSEAPDCGAQDGNCVQEQDVGVFSAQGLGGQFVVMHPGLDLVITAHNSSNPASLWADVRPAVVAMDPMFKGDMNAFCEAYGGGKYAPDLLAPRVAPTM